MSDKEFQYTKVSDTEFQWSDAPALFTSIVFFVCYDYENNECTILLKHGSKESINEYASKNLEKLKALESEECFSRTQHFVVDVTHCDLEEINKCMSISSYVSIFLRKFDLVPDEFDEHEIVE